MSIRSIILKGGALGVLLLLAGTSTALAAQLHAADVGGNLKYLIGGWGKDLLIPVAGLLGIAALFRRDVGHALTIAVIAIIVGIFVYDPGASSLISNIAKQITGG